MKRCKICILPETFPGISYNSEGICNFCLAYKGHEHLEREKQKYRERFENLVNKQRKNSRYDCLMVWSGGKDSTYTLYLLKKKYKLDVLTFTFDNGFISPITLKNIQNVADNLGVDHILFKPRFDIMKKIFIESGKHELYSKKTLERASTICTSCIALIKFIALKTALEKQVRFIAYGWSPGQAPITASVFKNNFNMLNQMQQVFRIPLLKIAGDSIDNYFIDNTELQEFDNFPYNVSPLAFLDYNEEKIYKSIRNLGWQNPEDTDTNSTNCLLNSYAISIHVKKYHYHPYVFELANLVREHYLTRDEALKKINSKINQNIIQNVQNKLIN